MTLFVVGSLHLDVVVRAPHLPQQDETVTGSEVSYVFGGKGGNQAVAAARMGADVSFAGRAGSDAFGDQLRSVLGAAGVDCTQLQRDDGPSGMSTAIVDAKGDYGAVIASAANLLIDTDAISIPGGTQLVVLQNEVPEAVNLAMAKKAKAAGAQIWLNAAPARAVSPALWDLLDLFIVNRVEAAFFERRLDPAKCIETLGAEGVRYAGQTHTAFPVEVHSTHGAGDMFVGALAAKVSKGAAIEAALAFAQAAAALHVASDMGARAELSDAAVDAFLAARSRR